jgi:hypothetical protein
VIFHGTRGNAALSLIRGGNVFGEINTATPEVSTRLASIPDNADKAALNLILLKNRQIRKLAKLWTATVKEGKTLQLKAATESDESGGSNGKLEIKG